MFKALDVFKIVFALLYITVVGFLVFLDVEIEKDIQDWLVILTHLVAIPLVVVVWETQWVSITLVVGILFSIVSHAAVVYDFYVDRIKPLDIAFANLTLMLIASIVIFEKIPEWTLPVLFIITVVNTSFWDVFWVYSIFSGAVNILVAFYIIYRLMYPSEKRNTTFMAIGLLLGVTGTVFFLRDGNYGDKNYGILHSVWHVCSYTSLYFAIRSLRPSVNPDALRRPRIEFARKLEFGKIAYH